MISGTGAAPLTASGIVLSVLLDVSNHGLLKGVIQRHFVSDFREGCRSGEVHLSAMAFLRPCE